MYTFNHSFPPHTITHKYNKLTAKSQKPIYSRIIYDEIRAMKPPGRFLKQDPKTKLWSDIGEKKALDKTRQALREGAPELLKEMEGGDSNDDGDKMKKKGGNNIAQQQQMEEIPLRMSNLTDSMFSATSLGGFSLGDVFNSFNAGVSVGASGGNNDGSGGIPGQIGGGRSMDNMFGPGVGADDILAAAAQIQAQQQAIQQQAIQQQQILRQQQQQQQNNNQQQQPQNMANLQAQLQLLKSMELQGGSNRSLGSNMDMGGNNNNNQQQQQQRNNSGMTIGTYDLNASSSAMSNSDISNFLSSMNNMANNSNHNPGMGRGQQQMVGNNNSMNPNAIMYQQQMLQQAMLNQMNNNPNYSNNNNFQGGGYDGHSSASTLPAGNLSSSNNRPGNNNNGAFGGNANAANQFQGGYQEKSFNTTVPLKSPGNEGGPMPSMTEEEGNPSMLDDMDTKSPSDSGASGGGGGQRRPGNMRGGASGDVNSSFTRAQRIGLKNSFTQKRRPNRKMQNAEMHNSLKNSLMSIESLSLEDLDSDIFEMKANETASPGDAPGSSNNSDRHGDGPHDMSEVSLPTFDQQDQGNV